jgi:hypothetical protein
MKRYYKILLSLLWILFLSFILTIVNRVNSEYERITTPVPYEICEEYDSMPWLLVCKEWQAPSFKQFTEQRFNSCDAWVDYYAENPVVCQKIYSIVLEKNDSKRYTERDRLLQDHWNAYTPDWIYILSKSE